MPDHLNDFFSNLKARGMQLIKQAGVLEPPLLGQWCSSSPVRATYRDTDKMGHVYYANYLVWFEIGRTDWLRQSGRSYREWEETEGLFLPVRHCEAHYHAPVLYDDVIQIRTRVVKMTKATVVFEYQILNEQETVCTTGSTQHPVVDGAGRVVRRLHELLPHMFNNR